MHEEKKMKIIIQTCDDHCLWCFLNGIIIIIYSFVFLSLFISLKCCLVLCIHFCFQLKWKTLYQIAYTMITLNDNNNPFPSLVIPLIFLVFFCLPFFLSQSFLFTSCICDVSFMSSIKSHILTIDIISITTRCVVISCVGIVAKTISFIIII